MTHQIDPVILQKLDAFSQRRRKLIILRGICAAVATLLLAMMLVAVIDAIFVLPDAARWALSLTAYAAVIVVEWRSSLRLLLHAPGSRRLARLVEHAEPKLREDLLSAVELGETATGEARDSEQFRALVQSDVAHRMESLDVERLLPVNLVRRYIGVGIVAALVCVVAFVLSGLQFGTLLLRALAPGANLARVSRVQVRIVEPSAPDKVVAQGETEPLVVEISGRRVNSARLETITAAGRDVLKMTPMGDDRFSATIQVGRDDVTYRVFAGDAVTKKFRLQAVARPHVVQFAKTFTYPEYVKLEKREVTEENGDLVALEGTEVELRLAANQTIRDAELRVEQGKQAFTVPLAIEGGQLVGRLSLKGSGTYRVHLTGAETGFENKFSPEYELRAEPDLVPQVELDAPRQDLILPANETVDVLGTASDDQGLAKVSQYVKINEERWKEVVLAKVPGQKVNVERRWDLYEQGVKPGDLVTMKLVAVDLKGSRAESRSLRVTITKSGFEPKRLGALEAQRHLYDTLKILRAGGEELRKRGKEAHDQFARLPEGDEQRRQVAISADAALVAFEKQWTDAWTQLETTLRAADAGHAGADLVQIGRTLTRMDAGVGQAAKETLTDIAADPAQPVARELMRDFSEACMKTEQRTKQAEDWYRDLLYAEEFEVIAENLSVVASESKRLTELAGNTKSDAPQWGQIANRARVILAESRSIDEIMDAAAEHESSKRLKAVRKQTSDARGQVEQKLAAGEPGPGILAPIQNFSRMADDVARQALATYRDLLTRCAKTHEEMVRANQPTYQFLEWLRDGKQGGRKLVKKKNGPAEIEAAIMDGAWERTGLTLKQHGDLEEMRTASDTYFVNDVRLTTLALDALRHPVAPATPDEAKARLMALEKSFRLLETGHNVSETLDALLHLSAGERWEIASARARGSNPRDWRWLEARLRSLPAEVSRVQPDEPLRAVVKEAQQLLTAGQGLPAMQELNREMNERFNPQRDPESAVQAIEPIAAQVKQALDLLRKPMDDARKLLAAMAPKLHEMMADLAKKTEELKAKTEEQAEKAADAKPEETQVAAEQALAQQQKLNERIDTLKDALRADANKQDIIEKEGRERARDADDALALLKEPPPNAEQALAEAAQVADPAAKAEAMKSAAQEQQKLASALDQLAKHYENAEKGKADESRMALRATEEQTGIKEAMDQQFAKAEQLAKMAEQSPEELLKELEKALPKNPAMQQELSSITRNTLDDAAAKLTAASGQENQVAKDLQKMTAEQQAQMAANQPPATPPAAADTPPAPAPPTAQTPPAPNQPPAPDAPAPPPGPASALAQAAEMQKPIAAVATQAGDDIARAGRHEQRLMNTPPGEKLEALGNQVKETAKQQVPKAGEALAAAKEAAQAAPAVNEANEKLKKHLGELQVAANAPKSAPTPPQASATPENPAAPMPAGDTPPSPSAPPAAAQANNAPATPTPPAAGAPGTPTPPAAQANNDAPAPPAGQPPAPAPGEIPPMPQLPSEFAQVPAGPATPIEQMWMARTLDSLDTALNAEPKAEAAEGQPGAQQAQAGEGKPQPGQQQPGKQPGEGKDMAQAQQAMNSAAQAAAAAMRASRGAKPPENSGEPSDDGPEQAVSRLGSKAQLDAKAYGKLGDAKGKAGDWGKLPKQVAEQLTRGQNENVAGEYRNQVETYYRVIAEKSKKP